MRRCDFAEEATRIARADIDGNLGPHLMGPSMETALRYREIDAWRQLAQRTGFRVPDWWPAPPAPAVVDAADAPPAPPPEQPA